MSRAAPLLCVALACSVTGCVHTLVSPCVRPDGPSVAAPARVTATTQVMRWTESPFGEGIEEVLRERLAARGVREVLSPTDVEPPAPLRLSLWAVGARGKGGVGAMQIPWFLASLATLGIVPYRSAVEYVIELRAVDPSAPPPARFRVSRRSYVVVSWMWTPLAFVSSHAELGDPGRRFHMRALARAIDEALDEVLSPAGPEGNVEPGLSDGPAYLPGRNAGPRD